MDRQSYPRIGEAQHRVSSEDIVHTAYDSAEFPRPRSPYDSSLAQEVELENFSNNPEADAEALVFPESGKPSTFEPHRPEVIVEKGSTVRQYLQELPFKVRGGLDKRLPIPGILELLFSFAGAYLSILAISALNRFAGEEKGILFLVGSFGASAVLLFGVTESKLAQPRNFVGGQILSSLVGLGLRHAIHVPWVVSPLAMALALTVMQLTSTTHPPGGATALIIASMDEIPRWAGFSYVAGVAGGCAVMLAVALIVNNLSPHRRYPTFWW